MEYEILPGVKVNLPDFNNPGHGLGQKPQSQPEGYGLGQSPAVDLGEHGVVELFKGVYEAGKLGFNALMDNPVGGGAEVAAKMGTGFAAAVPATVQGATWAAMAPEGERGDAYSAGFGEAAEKYTYAPKTATGKGYDKAIEDAYVKNIQEGWGDEYLGGLVDSGQITPEQAAMYRTSADALMLGLGLKGVGYIKAAGGKAGARAANKARAAETEAAARANYGEAYEANAGMDTPRTLAIGPGESMRGGPKAPQPPVRPQAPVENNLVPRSELEIAKSQRGGSVVIPPRGGEQAPANQMVEGEPVSSGQPESYVSPRVKELYPDSMAPDPAFEAEMQRQGQAIAGTMAKKPQSDPGTLTKKLATANKRLSAIFPKQRGGPKPPVDLSKARGKKLSAEWEKLWERTSETEDFFEEIFGAEWWKTNLKEGPGGELVLDNQAAIDMLRARGMREGYNPDLFVDGVTRLRIEYEKAQMKMQEIDKQVAAVERSAPGKESFNALADMASADKTNVVALPKPTPYRENLKKYPSMPDGDEPPVAGTLGEMKVPDGVKSRAAYRDGYKAGQSGDASSMSENADYWTGVVEGAKQSGIASTRVAAERVLGNLTPEGQKATYARIHDTDIEGEVVTRQLEAPDPDYVDEFMESMQAEGMDIEEMAEHLRRPEVNNGDVAEAEAMIAAIKKRGYQPMEWMAGDLGEFRAEPTPDGKWVVTDLKTGDVYDLDNIKDKTKLIQSIRSFDQMTSPNNLLKQEKGKLREEMSGERQVDPKYALDRVRKPNPDKPPPRRGPVGPGTKQRGGPKFVRADLETTLNVPDGFSQDTKSLVKSIERRRDLETNDPVDLMSDLEDRMYDLENPEVGKPSKQDLKEAEWLLENVYRDLERISDQRNDDLKPAKDAYRAQKEEQIFGTRGGQPIYESEVMPAGEQQPPRNALKAHDKKWIDDTTFYHGSYTEFGDFEPGRMGSVWASADRGFAESFGENLYEVKVKAKKPLDVINNPEHRQLLIDTFNENGGWAGNEDAMTGYDRKTADYDPDMDDLFELLDAPWNGASDDIFHMGYDAIITEEGGAPAVMLRDPSLLEKVPTKNSLAIGPGTKQRGGPKFTPKQQAAPTIIGDYKTTTSGRIRNKTMKDGGYTVDLNTGDVPDTGIMVGKFPNENSRTVVLEGKVTKQDLVDFARSNEKELKKVATYLGTWKNDDKIYLDIARRFESNQLRKSTKYGESTGQDAIYDLLMQQEHPVGNWKQFINSGEFTERMLEMEVIGRKYLKEHGGEWWDIHKTLFETVYGEKNLNIVAGYIASTAPMSDPTSNVQVFSEYMRRHIVGEPIIQPDWRVPANAMKRQPGSQVGNEASRKNNLMRSSRGELNKLQRDKVNQEAKALMGDPEAQVLDRWWSRIGEKPSEGIYTSGKEGNMDGDSVFEKDNYPFMAAAVRPVAAMLKETPRNFTANVWTGMRETVRWTGELFGVKYGKRPQGESKGYKDIFEDLIEAKAEHLGMSKGDFMKELGKGKAELLSLLIATPFGALLLEQLLSLADESENENNLAAPQSGAARRSGT